LVNNNEIINKKKKIVLIMSNENSDVNFCNIDEVNNEVYIVGNYRENWWRNKNNKKINKYYVDNIVGKIIHYYILIEISCHYIFSIGNSIGNFKCIITDNKPSPLSSSSISQQKQQPLPLFCHKSRPYTLKSSHLNTQ